MTIIEVFWLCVAAASLLPLALYLSVYMTVTAYRKAIYECDLQAQLANLKARRDNPDLQAEYDRVMKAMNSNPFQR